MNPTLSKESSNRTPPKESLNPTLSKEGLCVPGSLEDCSVYVAATQLLELSKKVVALPNGVLNTLEMYGTKTEHFQPKSFKTKRDESMDGAVDNKCVAGDSSVTVAGVGVDGVKHEEGKVCDTFETDSEGTKMEVIGCECPTGDMHVMNGEEGKDGFPLTKHNAHTCRGKRKIQENGESKDEFQKMRSINCVMEKALAGVSEEVMCNFVKDSTNWKKENEAVDKAKMRWKEAEMEDMEEAAETIGPMEVEANEKEFKEEASVLMVFENGEGRSLTEIVEEVTTEKRARRDAIDPVAMEKEKKMGNEEAMRLGGGGGKEVTGHMAEESVKRKEADETVMVEKEESKESNEPMAEEAVEKRVEELATQSSVVPGLYSPNFGKLYSTLFSISKIYLFFLAFVS